MARKKVNEANKELFKALIKENNLEIADDVQDLLKDMFGDILTEMLEGEL